MNHVSGRGLLTRFEERVVGQNGNRVAAMSVVLSKPRKKNPQTGQYENQDGTFVDVEAWNLGQDLVAFLANNVKNVLVTFVGRLEQERWTDKQSGGQRSKLKVVAEDIAVKKKPQRQQQHGQQQRQQTQTQQQTVPAGGGVDDSDIPF